MIFVFCIFYHIWTFSCLFNYFLMTTFLFVLKVYTCVSESVLANFVPFSTPKFLFYDDMMVPDRIYAYFEKELGNIKAKVCIFTKSSLEGISHSGSIDFIFVLIVDLLLFSMNFHWSIWISMSLQQNLHAIKYQEYTQLWCFVWVNLVYGWLLRYLFV